MASNRPAPKRHAHVTTARTGGHASTVSVLLAAAVLGGWLWWRKHTTEDEAAEGKQQGRQGRPVRKGAAPGGRSEFRFPGAGGSKSSSGRQRQQQQGGVARPSLPFQHQPGGSGSGAAAAGAGQGKGNAKKDKALRRARKEDKATEKVARDALEAAGVSSRGRAQDDGPQTVRYVDLTKTADAYDRVREWQETGKKRY